MRDSIIELGKVALAFGRVNRVTYHPDGLTPESDTDHTVMLGLVACAFAERFFPELNVGKIAQLALVHDLVEVYAGDTNTLHILSNNQKEAKEAKEKLALIKLKCKFGEELPWVTRLIEEYEDRLSLEARYVKAMDKLLPKITHILNDGASFKEQRVNKETVNRRYNIQFLEMQEYAYDFPVLFDLGEELMELVMDGFNG